MMGIAPKVTTEQMISAYKTLINNERNIIVYLVTRIAWKGYTLYILKKVRTLSGHLK